MSDPAHTRFSRTDHRTGSLLIIAVAAVVLGATIWSAPTASAQSGPVAPPATSGGRPAFMPGDCPSGLDLPEEFVPGESVQCGAVRVPQSRVRTDLPDLTLPVIVFTAPTAIPDATPLIYLAGGPGGSGLEEVALGFLESPLGQTLVRERPVIAFDQRGTGDSLPSLTCPMLPMVDTDAVAGMANARPPAIDQVRACRAELERRGINPASFNTTETSHDVRDILRALGHDRAILMGTSYGTTGVLFTLRNHPEIVESAILDGVAPPQWLDGYEQDVLEEEANRAFDRFLQDCEDDLVCSTEYPDLRLQFDEMRARSNERLQLFVDEETGETVEVSFGALAELFLQVFSIPELAEQIPLFITGVVEGNADLLSDELAFLIFLAGLGEVPEDIDPFDMPEESERAPRAIYDAVLCSDFPPGTSYGGRPVCEAWGVPFQGPQVSTPVSSAIPVLLLSGNYDFQTPPFWADQTARTLPNSHSYLFPAAGHVVTYSQHAACVAVIALSFIADPSLTPADTCIDELQGPRFVPRPDQPVL